MDENKRPFWTIGSAEDERLKIEILDAPADKSAEGYDWIETLATIKVGGFVGEANMTLTLSDLVRFKEELEVLYRDLSGAAEFSTIEGQVGFTVKGDGKGHMSVKGFFRDDVSFGNELTFKIQFDQTFFPKTISEIKRALADVKKL